MKFACIPALAILALALQPLHAQLQDTGPMGIEASGNPTPDASVLSKMRLPDAPKALSPTSTVALQKNAARMMRFHKVWLDAEAVAKRIQDAKDANKIGADKAAALQAGLDALKDKYKLKIEDDGRILTNAQRQDFAASLKAYGLKVDTELK